MFIRLFDTLFNKLFINTCIVLNKVLNKVLNLRTDISASSNIKYTVKNETYNLSNLTFIQSPKLLTTSSLNEGYDIMKLIHNLFSANNISYTAIGGTLLGAIRHKTQIPWDDDIDIAIIYSKQIYEKIASLQFEFMKKGYIILYCAPGFSIQKIFFPKISVDIFFMDKSLEKFHHNNYMLSYPYKNGVPTFITASLWPYERYPIDFDKLILTKFYDYSIYIPENYVEILNLMYNSSHETQSHVAELDSGRANAIKEVNNSSQETKPNQTGKICITEVLIDFRKVNASSAPPIPSWNNVVKYSDNQLIHIFRYFRGFQYFFEIFCEFFLGYSVFISIYKKIS